MWTTSFACEKIVYSKNNLLMARVALITGATSGIGKATALRLAKNDINLILTGRRRDRLQALKAEIENEYGVEVVTLAFDIRDKEAVATAVDSLPEEWKAIDILVNNAGLAAGFEHINEGVIDDWEAMIDTNVKGVLYITRIVSNLMIPRGHGHIINLGSIAGVMTYENGAVYCASKHAMHALSQGMRIDLLSHNIKVSEIRPGMVNTEFSTVRFHGDTEKADKVYTGVRPLVGDDIASIIEWLVQMPVHMNINEIEVMPTPQANSFYTYRKK